MAGVGVEGGLAFLIGLVMLRGNGAAVAVAISFLLLGVGIPAGYWLWLTNTRLLIGRGVIGYQDLFGRRRLWQPSDLERVVEVNIVYPGRGGGTPRPCLLLLGAGGKTLQKVRTAQWSGGAIEAFGSATGREREFMGTSMAIDVAKAFPGSIGWMYAHPGWSIVVGVVATIGTVLALEVFALRAHFVRRTPSRSRTYRLTSKRAISVAPRSRRPHQPTSSTSFPRTRPSSLTRCASAISASGKVCATGSEKRPDSISSPISASA